MHPGDYWFLFLGKNENKTSAYKAGKAGATFKEASRYTFERLSGLSGTLAWFAHLK